MWKLTDYQFQELESKESEGVITGKEARRLKRARAARKEGGRTGVSYEDKSSGRARKPGSEVDVGVEFDVNY